MKQNLIITLLILQNFCFAQFPPSAGTPGTTAIYKDSSIITNWATAIVDFERGYLDVSSPNNGYATFGESSNALGYAEGNSTDIVSLGDGGSITLTFENPIKNSNGPDFVVFENSFDENFLEFAHIEVSSDGERFVRIPSQSLTQTNTQTTSFGYSDPTKIHNLAGKYKQGYGTPFDLNDIVDSVDINLDSIKFVKVIDVVGSIDPNYGNYDSNGNLINDPYPTPFESGGFDLDAIGVINENKTVNINETTTINFSVYPNPVIDVLKIRPTQNGNIKIIEMTGRIVTEKVVVKNEEMVIYGLSKGIYIVEFSNSEQKTSKKIIVN